jgi:hypothetical protein
LGLLQMEAVFAFFKIELKVFFAIPIYGGFTL